MKRKVFLGTGGFGVVWRAIDKRNNKPVAVKQVWRIPETERFCARELEFMQKCKHQHIIELIDFIKDDSSYFFVMECCDSGNLDDFIKDRDIDFRVCLGYIKDMSGAIQFMHGREICHRDIKPSNVLVKNERCLKLADFGLSRELTDSSSGETATGRVGSTPWMAPEITRVKDEGISTAKGAKYKYGLAVDILV